MPTVISHDRVAHQFATEVGGAVSILEYALADGVMTIEHTGVPVELRGRGIAATLVHSALTAARNAGWKVVPACSYAAAWMQRHPAFDDLRA
jgi:predicted GNAT family acetyltransferase